MSNQRLPYMTIDPVRPGIILFDGSHSTGMFAGKRAADIINACNTYQAIKDALDTDEDGEALVEVARNAHRAERELAAIRQNKERSDDRQTNL